MRRKTILIISVCYALLHTSAASAQHAVTLQDAINSALTNGPRVAIVRADSQAAAARVQTARAYPNPTIAPSWTRSPPNYHVELEQPFEYPFLRSARIRAARLGLDAATYLAAAERAAIRYDVEVAYANAAAGMMIRTVSNRNVTDALEMLRITREREKVGDASELDIRLAEVSSGEAQLQALSDSLDAVQSILELQGLMGLNTTSLEVIPVDSLSAPLSVPPASELPLRVAAAQQQVQIEQANVSAARAARIPAPALRTGVEWHEPDINGLEPIIGISLPLPLWDRNRGPIGEARAAEARARADLALTQIETQNALTLAQQQLTIAQSRVARGRALLDQAERVASLSLTAYREGAYPLASVLEAQRSARDAVRTYVEALQASRIAQAAVTRAQVVGGPVP